MRREGRLPGRPATNTNSRSDLSANGGGEILLDAGPPESLEDDRSYSAEANPFHEQTENGEIEWVSLTPELEETIRLVGPLLLGGVAGCNSSPGIIEAASADGRLTATPLTSVAMRSIEWLERPLWQGSAFQLLAGAKGAGKGTYLAGLASRISKHANVLFVSTEDSTEIDLKPRLVAAGADIDRCYVIQQHVLLPDDVDSLRTLANGIGGVGLYVIDPVANHIGDSNSNSDTEVRHAIAPLNQLADELGCLLIGVRHPGKDRSRGAVASILGSTAWVDTPRAVVMIAVDDEDPLIRHIQVVAGNRSLNGSAQAFRIEAVTVDGLTEPITLAVPLGESAKSVDDLLAPQLRANRVPAELLCEIVLRKLEHGERTRKQLDDVCKAETGANPDSVYKSALAPLKNEGRIRARKDGTTGGWFWRLDLSEQLG